MEQVDAVLIVEQGDRKGKTYRLKSGRIVLGRGQAGANKIVFDNSFVSRNHSEIHYKDNSFMLRDLGSTNGTQLNGEPLEEMVDYTLKDNDVIQLARESIVLRFRRNQKTVEIDAGELSIISAQILTVDGESRDVWIKGVKLDPPLSTRDFDLLLYLYARQEKACNKDALAEAWGEEYATDEQIEQCIHRIRQRVEPDPRNPSLIVTIRGYGYKLTISAQA